MSRMLDTMSTEAAIRDLVSSGEPLKVAVAYWGYGATERLCLKDRKNIQIICDLLSGGCNPEEIKKLQKAIGRKNVLTLDRLHAKVWITPTRAVMGSSNASANGLAFEGNEALSLIEANLRVDAADTIAALESWWASKVLPQARPITDSDLKTAADLFRRRRLIRPIAPAADLLTALVADPDAFRDRNLYVWIWKQEDASAWTKAALAEAKMTRSSKLDFWQDVDNPPPPGSHVVDFSVVNGRADFRGLWQVLTEEPEFKPASGEGTLLLCLEQTRFEGIPVGNRRAWEAAASKAFAARPEPDEWKADEFGEWCKENL